jgi:hypothetical protein
MQLPATTYRHGCNQGRRGSNAGVSPHCFAAHPVMGGETCHCARLTVHCTSPVTLEGGYDKARIPQSLGFGLIHPVSTRSRPSLDASHSSTGKEGRHGAALQVTMASHPLRHHGVWGWPSIPRARRYSHLNRDRQKHHFKTPRCPGLLSPYKRAGRGTTKGTSWTQDRDQHLKQSPLYSFSSL